MGLSWTADDRLVPPARRRLVPLIAGRDRLVGWVATLGVTAMAAAAISDGGYALLAGGARNLMSKSRVRLVSRIGGVCLIGGGAWLALARTR